MIKFVCLLIEFQYVMNYLYNGGAENMKIPSVDILEVRSKIKIVQLYVIYFLINF